ncbi:MAG: sodium:calcium antiporter [Candidatus Bipolaricaulia bacterium]
MNAWIVFALCAGGIVLAGMRLALYGNALGRHLHIGQGWIGLIFLATLTSIPELTTTVTAASIGEPSIAVGNALGSNLFNVAIIAVMDILLLRRRPGSFLALVRPYHVISGGMAILLTALALLGIVWKPGGAVLGISPISVFILIGYCAGVFLLFRAEREDQTEDEPSTRKLPSLVVSSIGFLVCGAIIVVCGIYLVHASKTIAVTTGLSASFMGAILVAIVTSLPELATSIGALRINATDMIIGNLFGSNMFNILTIFFADAAFRGSSILGSLGDGEGDLLLVAGSGIILTGIAVVSIAARTRRRVFGIGVDSIVLLGVYVAVTAVIIGRGIQL